MWRQERSQPGAGGLHPVQPQLTHGKISQDDDDGQDLIFLHLQWSSHSETLEAREEAAVAVLDTRMFYMGGVGLSTVETMDLSGGNSWSSGPKLPLVMSRSCAVSTGDSVIITGGHNNNTGRQGWPGELSGIS